MSIGSSRPDWFPLGVEGTDEDVEFSIFREDIPDWMASGLWQWIADAFVEHDPTGWIETPSFDLLLLRHSKLEIHVAVPWYNPSFDAGVDALRGVYAGRSAWTIGQRDGKPGLARRLPDGVQTAAEATFGLGDAGKLLALAWRHAYGVEPDASRAYSQAIKAVEAAAIPVVCPRQLDATLGNVIGELNSNPSWTLPHQREHSDAKARDVLVAMSRLFYRGQHDRHASALLPPPEMTVEEARSAPRALTCRVNAVDVVSITVAIERNGNICIGFGEKVDKRVIDQRTVTQDGKADFCVTSSHRIEQNVSELLHPRNRNRWLATFHQ